MDSTSMLESKIIRFTCFEDILYFLGSSIANVPQKISEQFVSFYKPLMIRAIREDNAQSVSVLVKVLDHIIQQDNNETMQILIASNLHQIFGIIFDFAFGQISSEKNRRSFGDKIFLTFLGLTIQYGEKIDYRYEWFFQNMMYRVLDIITEPSVYYHIRMQAVDMFLNVFAPDNEEVVFNFRNCINRNQDMYDMLCNRAMKNLSQAGDFQLQESLIELIFRMWSTDLRKIKASKWCDGKQHILSKFLSISYTKFDFGVRMFLNEVNSSGLKRKVLTMYYKELQVGTQALTPSNQWCNCVDFCYESKDLSIRFPAEEASQPNTCSWNLGAIRTTDLTSFYTSENTALRTIDLHLELGSFTSQILHDFTFEDEIATNLIIRFYRVSPIDSQHLLRFTTSLFGSKFANVQKRRKNTVSKPKATLVFNAEPGSQPRKNIQSSSSDGANRGQISSSRTQNFIQCKEKSRASRPSFKHIFSNQPCVALERSSQIDSLNKPCSRSQVLRQNDMMKNLAIHAVNERKSHGPSGSASERFNNDVSSRKVSSHAYKMNLPKPSSLASHYSRPSSVAEKMLSQALTEKTHSLFMNEATSRASQTKVLSRAIMENDDSDFKEMSSHVQLEKDHSTRSRATTHSVTSSLKTSSKASVSIKKSKSECEQANKTHLKSINAEGNSKNVSSSDNRTNKADKVSTKPLSEIVQESGNVSVEWKDIIPETQGLHNISADITAGNISPYLMLSCFQPRSETKSQMINVKSNVSPKMISIDMPRRVTRNLKKATQKLNDSISPAFPSQVLSSVVDMNNNVTKEPVLATEQPTRNKTEIKEKRNKQFAVAKANCEFESTTGTSKSSKNSGKSGKQRKPTVVEIFKTDTEYETEAVTETEIEDTAFQTDGNSTDNKSVFADVLKWMNMDPKPIRLEKVKEKKNPKRKRTKTSELPFADVEEIPEIEIFDNDNYIVKHIETVRDAAPVMEEIPQIESPEPILVTSKRRNRSRIIDTTETSEPEISKKKRSRVSFDKLDPNLRDNEVELNSKKGREKKSKRSKKARLFDSTSSAASVASSDLSWVKEHKNKSKNSPIPLKTYAHRKNVNSPLNLLSLDRLTSNATRGIATSTSSSSSPEPVRGGDVNDNSLMSGITRMQSLASASNLTFDDIVFGNEKDKSTNPVTEVSPLKPISLDETTIKLASPELKKLPTYEWNNDADIDLEICRPKVDSLDLSAWKNLPVDEISFSTSESDSQKKTEFSKKKSENCLPPNALELARLNNNTPVETSGRERFVKTKPLKRKVEKDSPCVSLTSLNNVEYKSKKKLDMKSTEPSMNMTSMNNTTNDRSGGKCRKMIKLMGKYIRDVDSTWSAGDTKRDNCLQSFVSKTTDCERQHNQLMKGLKQMEEETVDFIHKYNGKVEKVMTGAAKNIVDMKASHSKLVKRLHRSNCDQNNALEKLRSQISAELRDIIQNVED